MHMNPRRVTMFGANHSGNSSTKAFHYGLISAEFYAAMWRRRGVQEGSAYIWPQDVV
jgi:hypothetical protein